MLVFSLIPNIYAYGDYLIAGGDNIGIEIKLDGILVVGTYDIGYSNGLKLGDVITHVDNNVINSVDDFIKYATKEELTITYIRNDKELKTTINLKYEDGVYKTGLYVKDKINGIGTLTYIDPESNMFGALGHAIIEKNTMSIPKIDTGSIYESTVTGINKSEINNAGYKNAIYNKSNIFGNINENTDSGIFGNYTANIDNKLYKISKDVMLGRAYILTELDDNVIKKYEINIEKVTSGLTKNILFSVVDDELIDKTGGIVQGMSGSPIIQNNSIIGAVTHVVLEDPTKGYGIFITNMLDEMEN